VVLVADDDPQVRQLVAAVLDKMGCLVLQAPDGTVALEMVREAHPDHGAESLGAAARIADLTEARRILLAS